MKRLINCLLLCTALLFIGCNDADESSVLGGKEPLDVTSKNLAGKWEAYKSFDSLSNLWISDYGKSGQYYYVLTMKESGTYDVSGRDSGISYSYSGVYTINDSVLTLYISTSGEMELIMEANVESLTGSELVLREDIDDANHTLLYLHRR